MRLVGLHIWGGLNGWGSCGEMMLICRSYVKMGYRLFMQGPLSNTAWQQTKFCLGNTISSLSYTKKLKAIILCARFSIAEADETVMVEIFAEKMLVVLSAIS